MSQSSGQGSDQTGQDLHQNRSQDWKDTLYEKLINDEDARACEAIDDSACREVPGNASRILVSQFLTQLGDALMNPKVTLPWLFQSLGAPAFFLAWLVPIRESGSLLPQLAIASMVRQLPVRKWVWVTGSLIQALCVIGMAGVAFVWQEQGQGHGQTAGWLLLTLLVVFSLARGLCSVASKDVLGKTIPKKQRGQLTGWSGSAAGLITLAVALGLILSADYANSNQVEATWLMCGLLAAGGCWLLAASMFAGVKESAGEVDGGRNGLTEAFAQMKILKTDADFRRFVISRALFLCTALSAPYYIVLASQNQNSGLHTLALFLGASGLASLVSAPIWGRFADLSSRNVMTLGGAGAALIGAVPFASSEWLPALIESHWFLPLLYFALMIFHQGVRVGRKTYLVNLGSGNQRTRYVAVSNTLIGVILLLMSFTGLLGEWLSLEGLILAFSVMGVAGVAMTRSLPDV